MHEMCGDQISEEEYDSQETLEQCFTLYLRSRRCPIHHPQPFPPEIVRVMRTSFYCGVLAYRMLTNKATQEVISGLSTFAMKKALDRHTALQQEIDDFLHESEMKVQ